MSGLIVTRLDVLSGIGDLKVCTGYRLDGRDIPSMPANIDDLSRVEPVYETLPGWEGDLRSARALSDLGRNVQSYVKFIEDFTQTPVAILSIGPDRKETVMLRPDLIWG